MDFDDDNDDSDVDAKVNKQCHYGRTLSDASMSYFADVFYIFYGRLSWPNGRTDLHETFTRGRY